MLLTGCRSVVSCLESDIESKNNECLVFSCNQILPHCFEADLRKSAVLAFVHVRLTRLIHRHTAPHLLKMLAGLSPL